MACTSTAVEAEARRWRCEGFWHSCAKSLGWSRHSFRRRARALAIAEMPSRPALDPTHCKARSILSLSRLVAVRLRGTAS